MTDFPLKVGDTTTEEALREAFPDAIFIGWPDPDPEEETPYRTDQEREDYPEDLFDLLLNIAVEAGFSPADMDEAPSWITEHYEGYRQDRKGFLCFTTEDEELHLYLMTSSGVQRAQVTFTYNQEGLDMFAAVVKEET